MLANWSIVEGRPWDERLGSWLRDDCDALVVQRETLDPAAYVELWLKDSGHHGGPDYASATTPGSRGSRSRASRASASAGSTCRLRRGRAAHELLEWPYDVEQPIGPAIHAWGEAVADLRGVTDDQLLDRTLRARDDVQQETVGRPAPRTPRRSCSASSAASGGRVRPTRSRPRSSGPATATSRSASSSARWPRCSSATSPTLRTTYLPVVRELVGEGFLEVSDCSRA